MNFSRINAAKLIKIGHDIMMCYRKNYVLRSTVEVCMGMGISGIPWVPWDSHGNGNSVWYFDWNGSGKRLDGKGKVGFFDIPIPNVFISE